MQIDKGRILHIAQDEKFINAAHYLFEKAFPGANQFVIVKPPANPPLRYINGEVQPKFLILSPSTISRLLEMCKEADIVILHGLDKMKGSLFLKSTEKYKFIGMVYGAEIYNDQILENDFLGEKTRQLDQKLQKQQSNNMLEQLKDLYRSIKYSDTSHLYDAVDMRKVFTHLPAFGFTSRATFEKHLSAGILNPESRMIPFSYYPVDYILSDDNLQVNGRNILLGNSASATNNHLEAIDLLKNIHLERKVITPLSYGQADYADAVEGYGKKQLGESFVPFREFLPLQSYNQLICSCQYVVMNHYRSQAMGNLITSLYLGAKVFVNDTDAYRYFKNIGCHIYLINQDLVPGGEAGLTPLTREQVKNNRQVLRAELSTAVLADRLRTSIMELLGIRVKNIIGSH